MSGIQDCSARCLVYAARLHTYNTVLNNVDDSDTVFSAKFIQLADDIRYFHFFAIDTLRHTFFKSHSNIFCFVRSLFRCGRHYQKVIVVRFIGRIFQFQTFMADMP